MDHAYMVWLTKDNKTKLTFYYLRPNTTSSLIPLGKKLEVVLLFATLFLVKSVKMESSKHLVSHSQSQKTIKQTKDKKKSQTSFWSFYC